MEKLTVNFGKVTGQMKAMHGVGQPPLQGISTKAFHYLKDAHIPFSRLHDVGGWFGGNMWVDIPNIFRDFDADESKEENYDFAFTDILLQGLMDNDCAPVFRLGVTIENFHTVKAYRIFPPEDYAKWARICEHIIRHYNEGWADGFYYGVQYWEIWNEADNGPTPESNSMWKGTPEQFYELYAVTAKHLKTCFGDTVKVGGYGSSGVGYALCYPEKYGLPFTPIATDTYLTERGEHMLNFFEGFMEYISIRKVPLDFFSWHAYGLGPDLIANCSVYIDKALERYGYGRTENQLNEWSVAPTTKLQGTHMAAARCAATMCAMQDRSTNILCIYDARMTASIYAALFNSFSKEPFPLYYALKAFGELYALGNQVESSVTGEKLYVQAAAGEEGRAVLLTNISDADVEIETNLGEDMKAYVIDETHRLEELPINPGRFLLPADHVILFHNR